MKRKYFRCFLVFFLILFFSIFLTIIFSNKLEDIKDDIILNNVLNDPDSWETEIQQHFEIPNRSVTDPIILWWTPFTGDPGSYKTCGDVQCFFSINRGYRNHEKTRAFMFYGTDFKGHDLPVPRKSQHYWGLLHEESPKNNYLFSFGEIMELFNFTSTFRRESSYPIPTQYLDSIEWLESKKYFVPTEEKNEYLSELSPIIYTQSDCGCPSGRDQLAQMLMNEINIDSYGTCLHNKDLPKNLRDPIQGMDHKQFYQLNAKYKFSLAFENGLCPDYMTEKLWRPLYLGSVPIILGSPRVKDFLPSNYSAIVVDDFKTVKELAEYIKYLNSNDKEYNKYLDWKRTGVTNTYLKNHVSEREWGLQNDMSRAEINFIDGFQCHVCKKIHENIRREREGKSTLTFQANEDHYGCPGPVSLDSNGKQREGGSNIWDYEYKRSKYLAKAVNRLVCSREKYSKQDIIKMYKDVKNELR